VPLAKVATKLLVGKRLRDLGLTEDIRTDHISVKTPVFPFAKFPGTDVYLGPEMKSTGEVMGMATNFGIAFAKAQMAAGNHLPLKGNVFISVNDFDKPKVVAIAKELEKLGFGLMASTGTAAALEKAGLKVQRVYKVNEGRPNVVDRIINKEIQLIINTPLGKTSRYDEYAMGRAALTYGVPQLTTLSASWAAVEGIKALRNEKLTVRSLQEYNGRKEA